MTTENELIFLRLIEGMLDIWYKHEILERLKISYMNLETSREFLQELELKSSTNEKISKRPKTQPCSWSNANIVTRNMRKIMNAQPWETFVQIAKK